MQVALVSVSLSPPKGKYQTIVNNLPKGGVLICQTDKRKRIMSILEQVAQWPRENGHFVETLPSSLLRSGLLEVCGTKWSHRHTL
jgi:hypothetical protein